MFQSEDTGMFFWKVFKFINIFREQTTSSRIWKISAKTSICQIDFSAMPVMILFLLFPKLSKFLQYYFIGCTMGINHAIKYLIQTKQWPRAFV